MIMQIIWNEGETTVEVIRDQLEQKGRALALPSVRTMLSILQEKEYVTRRSEGRKHVYEPAVSQEKAQKSMLKEMLDSTFDGSALNLVAALVNSKLVKPRDIDKVKSMLENNQPKKK